LSYGVAKITLAQDSWSSALPREAPTAQAENALQKMKTAGPSYKRTY